MSPSSYTTPQSRGHHTFCNPPISNNLPPHLIAPHHHHQIHQPLFHPCFRLSPGFLPSTNSSNTVTAEPERCSGLPQTTPSISFTPTNLFHHFHNHYHGCLAFCSPHFQPSFRLSPGFLPSMTSSHTVTAEPECSSGLPQTTTSISFTPTNFFRHFHHHYHGCFAFCQSVPYHPCRRLLLPPPSRGFSSLHAEERQNHEVEVQNSGLQEVGDEAGDEDEDPVFVMTDEWLEFFAKSEAKRRQDKELKQKKVGNQQKRKGSN